MTLPSMETLAQLSDNLVYSAIAVYALAMLAYAALSARRPEAHRQQPAAAPAVEATIGARADPGSRRSVGAPGEEARDATGPAPHTDASVNAVDRLSAIAAALTILGFLLHLSGVVARGFAAGRAPWGNMYEFAVVAALAAAAAFLVFLRREPVRALGVWITAIVVLTLGLSVTVLYTPAGALVPVLNSYWLVIHVAAAITAGGVFTIGAVAILLYRLRLRAERRGPAHTGYAGRLPAASTLNRVAHTANLFAFPIWTFAVIAGAIWAENSWGRYWGWDPKETWAFITWVLYAAYLHAEATAGWRGTKASWFALLGYAAFVFNFFGVNMWISGLHSYAGI
ncbi:c-type cytochrome biogenesis protein CcsB [Nocardioides caldifontis]|uniref:c-type cytochrome biogenesis protein CcsB n=1 Tax=Nocardioides caldifontis TaxID=2588938 RepID=UPI001EF14DA4|nr:c-type cytochrome biogenesis protein CcsB [Nocardioides caldifontis]